VSKLESHLSVAQRLGQVITLHVSASALQQGIVLLSASLAGNLFQYLFHFAAGRILGPTEYGIFASLLALSVILTVPTGIAQTVVTQYTAGFFARKEMGKASGFALDAASRLTVVSLLIFVLVALASPIIAAFLNIPSIWPVVAMGSFFFFAGPLTVLTGALQGLQRFYGVGAQIVLGPGFRLLAGLLLVGLGLGAAGALSATAVSNLIVLALTVPLVRDLLGAPRSQHSLQLLQVTSYTGLVFWGTLAFVVVTNVDLVIVKHFFEPLQAGYYSAASVLGKTILVLPGAVAVFLFPKSSFRYALGQGASDLVRKSGIITLALSGLAAVALYVFQTPAVLIMFGDEYRQAAPLVGMYGATMALFALVQLLFNYYLSRQDARFVWLLVVSAVALGVFLALVHPSLEFVILSLACGGLGILVISEVWLDGFGFVELIKTNIR
jgi:O-antigen/teichoic acid export membrane protein